jgi:hypothetical protein
VSDSSSAKARSLYTLAEAFRSGISWPPSEEHLGYLVAQGLQPDKACQWVELAVRTRGAIEVYLGQPFGDDPSVRLLYGRLANDFGISPSEADRLNGLHLATLLVQWSRWRNGPSSAVQDVLHHVATIKRTTRSAPFDPVSTPVFLKALDRFPAPEALEVATHLPPKPEATTSPKPESEANEEPDPPATKQAPRKRNEGKAERCLGIYMDAINRNVTPPTPSELAKQVGCSPGTASRAIAAWEATRKEFAKDGAKSRYRQTN